MRTASPELLCNEGLCNAECRAEPGNVIHTGCDAMEHGGFSRSVARRDAGRGLKHGIERGIVLERPSGGTTPRADLARR
jgi:hypothetical protein